MNQNIGKFQIRIDSIVMIAILLVSLSFSLAAFRRAKQEPEVVVQTVTETIYLPTIATILERDQITEAIRLYMAEGRLDKVAGFYNSYVKNWELTYLILAAAHMYDIPANILFSVIFAESGFNVYAVNNGNGNGSSDFGLMQLNSNTFKGYTRKQLMDRYINLQLGCKYLKKNFERYGTWEEAVMYYNGFSKTSVIHQSRVLVKERVLDRGFNESGLGLILPILEE